MEEADLYVINQDTKSRMGEIGQRDFNLDLIMGNAKVVNAISYKQEIDAWGSDHFPINFVCETDASIYRKLTNRISTKKMDWKYLGHYIKEKESIFDSAEYREMFEEDKYSTIINKIREATFEASGINYVLEQGRVVRFLKKNKGLVGKSHNERRKTL